jgi:hypothetical protein
MFCKCQLTNVSNSTRQAISVLEYLINVAVWSGKNETNEEKHPR